MSDGTNTPQPCCEVEGLYWRNKLGAAFATIKRLEAELSTERDARDVAETKKVIADGRGDGWKTRAETAERRLAEAVEALEFYSSEVHWPDGVAGWTCARAALARLATPEQPK